MYEIVLIDNENKLDLNKEEIKKYIEFILTKEKQENTQVNIIFMQDVEIQKLNKQYRGYDKPTDVLSFPYINEFELNLPVNILGDIFISLETALKQSEEYKHSFKREIYFLITHGILHLLGYDHIEKNDEIIMFTRQEEILNEYEIKREI